MRAPRGDGRRGRPHPPPCAPRESPCVRFPGRMSSSARTIRRPTVASPLLPAGRLAEEGRRSSVAANANAVATRAPEMRMRATIRARSSRGPRRIRRRLDLARRERASARGLGDRSRFLSVAALRRPRRAGGAPSRLGGRSARDPRPEPHRGDPRREPTDGGARSRREKHGNRTRSSAARRQDRRTRPAGAVPGGRREPLLAVARRMARLGATRARRRQHVEPPDVAPPRRRVRALASGRSARRSIVAAAPRSADRSLTPSDRHRLVGPSTTRR